MPGVDRLAAALVELREAAGVAAAGARPDAR
jgi:hypothetical protein